MPLKCTVCYHESQAEIDQMLLAGTSLRIVAKRFGTSTTSLHRHISKILVKAKESAQIAKADTLLDQVRNLLSQAERLTERAEQAGSLDTALRGIAQVRSVLELLGQVSGQVAGKGTNIAIGINIPLEARASARDYTEDELKAIIADQYPQQIAHQAPTLEGTR
jgi:hypothetical protein